MKQLLDFLPIIIFFAVYQFTDDLIFATAVLIPVTVVQVGLVYLLTKTIEKMALATLALVVVLGGLTVLLQDGWFIMWKPTVVNWLFALVFLGSHAIGERTIVERMMGHAIALPQRHWRRLSFSWVCFFIASGIANLVVAYQFSEAVWVNFKLFGLLGLTILFVIAQGIWISRHAQSAASDDSSTPS